MDVVPLLAHKEEEPFRVVHCGHSKVIRDRRQDIRTYRDLQSFSMGQSAVKGNQIQDSFQNDWIMPNSRIKLNMQEILQIKEVFKMLARLSPEDQCISKQTFLHYFPLDGLLGQRLFGIFDTNSDEKINAGEFLSGISLCLRGTMADKCNLLFRMFDLDEDEGVSEDELYRMLKPTLKAADSLSRKVSFREDYKGEDFTETARLLVHEAFEECDLEQTGKLSFQNFQSWISGHRELVKAVFSHPFQSLINKNARYEDLKDNRKTDRRLHPQTWMDEHSDTTLSHDLEKSFNLQNARHLWSPLFPDSGSKFPPCRSKHAAVLYYGSIYIFGGRGKSSTLKDIWRYSLSENKWDQIKLQCGSIIPALEEHTAVIYKNQAYIFGGMFAVDKRTPFWSYEFETSKWKDLNHSSYQKEPINRRGHTAVIYRDSMFLFGGILDTGHASNELWRYNFESFRWYLLVPKEGTEAITPRHSHTSVVHNNCIWVFGGIDARGRKNDIWTWNFEFYIWTKIKHKGGPPPIAKHTASKMGALMIVFGGEQNEPRNETWSFNFESIEWKKVTPLSSIAPTQRSNHAMITLSPYSAHSGPLSYSRPLTAKSAPDHTAVSSSSPRFQHFQRAASAESFLDFHDKRLAKGKSLDLTFELDNPGYDKSIPDITKDPSWNWSGEDLQQDNTKFIEVKPCSDSSLQNVEQASQFVQKNWAIVVISGKGKLCTDLYQTSVDIWRCEIGHDVGMQYQADYSVQHMKGGKAQNQQQQYRSRPTRRVPLDRPAFRGTNPVAETTSQEQVNWRNSRDFDRLIITDLTGNEPELDTADRNLLR